MKSKTTILMATVVLIGACSHTEEVPNYHELMKDKKAYDHAEQLCAASKTMMDAMNNPWCQVRNKAETCLNSRSWSHALGQAPDPEPNGVCPAD